MFDKLTIRSKLIAIVAAPLLVLVMLAGSGSLQRSAEAGRTRADAARIDIVAKAAATAQDLQAETLLTAAYLASRDVAAADMKAARARTDADIAAFRAAVGPVSAAQSSDRVVLSSAQGQLGFMGDLRAQVDRRDGTWPELTNQYFQIEDAVLQVGSSAFASDVNDPKLTLGMQAAGSLSAYKSAVAREATILTGALGTGRFPDAAKGDTTNSNLWNTFQRAVANGDLRLAEYNSGASADARRSLRNTLSGSGVDLFDGTVSTVRSGQPSDRIDGDPAAFHRAAQDVLGRVRGIESGAFTTLLATAHHHASAASQSSRIYILGAILAALLCLVLATVVSTSITRPLAKLTDAVDHVAKEQLPKLVESLRNPVQEDMAFLSGSGTRLDVGGGAELAHLGSAVAQIQQVAVDVATEQASLLRKGIGDMFVNLARRNQTLLDRQIEFIDELEENEEDPDHLEGLYKLDHMATRMRRNAESLLVLAGAEPTRRRGRPVALADVVRAALGEVEDYGRIDLLGLDEVLVKSSAALDVAHMLSELMENSTHFSPPDTRVEVVGHRTKSDGYVVSITDHGIGMTAEQLAESNDLLARPPLMGLAMSRSLGFIVIGRLAARFAITVRLMPSPTGGITAVVAIPADVVTDVPPAADADERSINQAVEAPLASVTSILPPLEFTYMSSEPDTFDDAVPTGAALDDHLSRLADDDRHRRPPADPDEVEVYDHDDPRAYRGRESDAPRSRAIDPAKVAFGMPSRVPAPAAEPVRQAPTAPAEPVAAPAALAPPAPPTPSVAPGLFGGGSPVAASSLPEPLPGAGDPLPEPSSGGLPSPVGEQTAPAAGPFAPPADDAGLFGHGPAPTRDDPLPARRQPAAFSAPAPAAPPAPAPVAPFAPAPAAPAAGPFAPPPAAEPAAPSGTRLFGSPAAAGAAPRLFGSPAVVPTSAAAPGVPTPNAGDDVTAAGLVRRRPRGEEGGDRKLPGSDGGARNVTTTQRSPDEVRSMLARFRSGSQQAAAGASTPDPAEPAPTAAP